MTETISVFYNKHEKNLEVTLNRLFAHIYKYFYWKRKAENIVDVVKNAAYSYYNIGVYGKNHRFLTCHS